MALGIDAKIVFGGWHFEYSNGRPDYKFFKKDLEHCNACVDLAGNNLELHRQWETKSFRQQQYALDLADKSRRASRHNMSVMHVLV